jgi:hypothetical protein
MSIAYKLILPSARVERETERETERESVTDRQTGKEQRRGLCTPHDCIRRAQKHAPHLP